MKVIAPSYLERETDYLAKRGVYFAQNIADALKARNELTGKTRILTSPEPNAVMAATALAMEIRMWPEIQSNVWLDADAQKIYEEKFGEKTYPGYLINALGRIEEETLTRSGNLVVVSQLAAITLNREIAPPTMQDNVFLEDGWITEYSLNPPAFVSIQSVPVHLRRK